MKSKKAQIGIGTYGLIDASTLPKFLLYPLIFLVCSILLVATIVMILFIVAWFKGDAQFIPFGRFGYYGMPIYFSSHTTSECFVNGVRVVCENISGGLI